MPGRWRKKSGLWRTLSARHWHKRIWRRCLMWPSLWDCDSLIGERGGRGRSAAQPIRWRCSPSPGGRNMCASSRGEGDNISVTDVKLELLTYLGVLRCKDSLLLSHGRPQMTYCDFNAMEQQFSRGTWLSYMAVWGFDGFTLARKDPMLMPKRQYKVVTTVCSSEPVCKMWLWPSWNQNLWH